MNWDFLKPLLQGWATSALAALGASMGLTGDAKSQFVGAGLVLLSFAWEWWRSRGEQKFTDLMKKITKTDTKKDAVAAAQVLPSGAAVDTASKSAVVQSVTKVLIVAFALSFLLAGGQAMAQVKKDPLQQFNDKLKQDFTAKTGVQATGDVGFDLLRMLDAKLLPDLQYAQKLADANGNKLTSACWGAWIGIIQTNETAVQNKNADGTTTDIAIPDPHLITDLERAIDIRNALQPQSPFMVACSPVANLIKQDVMNFIGQVIGGGLSLTKLMPGLL